jgi:hypothetical protein
VEKIAILTSDRYFVKLVEEEEVPVKAEELVEGDIFSLYSDSSKQTKCHWGETTIFKCEGPVFNNEEDVQYIQCSLSLTNKSSKLLQINGRKVYPPTPVKFGDFYL